MYKLIVSFVLFFVLINVPIFVHAAPECTQVDSVCTTKQGYEGACDENLECIDNCVVDGVPTLTCLEHIIGNGLNLSTGLVILILFVMFVYGGFLYITSFGDAKKAQTAQKTLQYAVIGFIIFLSSFIILNTIDKLFLGGEGRLFNFNFSNSSQSNP